MTTPVTDPFADPVTPPSSFPTQASLRGRLVLVTARKIESVPNTMNPGQMQERITADITVVDGLGPVPQMKNNVHTGGFLDGPDFTGVWLNGTRVVDQLRTYVGGTQKVLGVIETYKPGEVPVKGNPWGINAATQEQKATARAFLANRTVGAAVAPQAAAPVTGTPTGPILAAQPGAVTAPPVQAAPAVPAPGSAPAGVNPFA